MKQINEILRFGLVGIIATIINYCTYWLLKETITPPIAYTIGYMCSLFCNYILSSFLTFRQKLSGIRFLRFGICHTVNCLLQIALISAFIKAGVADNWAPMPVYGISLPLNFIMVRRAILSPLCTHHIPQVTKNKC